METYRCFPTPQSLMKSDYRLLCFLWLFEFGGPLPVEECLAHCIPFPHTDWPSSPMRRIRTVT